MNSKGEEVQFSGWRAFLWPVHNHELKKLIPMLIIFFLLSFNYNLLRIVKDSLVITAKSSGAEVIPFIKVWVMFPCTILMTILYTKLSKRFSRETVIYTIFSLFIGFFFIFAVFLYPSRDWLHPYETANALQTALPAGFKWIISIYRNWTFTAFYVMAELWSNIILFLLFWGFANQVTKLGEAKRFYGIFGVGANFSGVIAGYVSILLSRGSHQWETSLNLIISLVIITGILTLILFRKLTQSLSIENVKEQPNKKISFRKSFSYLMQSKYLLGIAIIVLSYNICINLVEVVWKHQMRELYPDPKDYNLYFSYVTCFIGWVATLGSLLVSGNSVRKFGWTLTSIITPAILLITSFAFFSSFFLKDFMIANSISILGLTPLGLVVLLGSLQNVMSRSAKYTVFDTTKEIAFIPLDEESKVKGKACIDGVCSRLGKSGGSIIHQGLLFTFASISSSASYVALLLFGIAGIWTYVVLIIGKEFKRLSGDEHSLSSIKVEFGEENELEVQKVAL